MNTKVFTLLMLSFVSAAFAEDFKTINGKEYKDAAVTRVEPDGIVLKTKWGISKVYFVELPKEVQERFAYDPQKAADYLAQQNAAFEQARKQQQEALRQKADETEKNNRLLAEQRSAIEAAKNQQHRVEALQIRYQELQRQEDDLLLRIGEAKRPTSWQTLGRRRQKVLNPLAAELPYLESQLKDVRHERDQIRKQLEKAQR
jgi:DNA repair ATPase RecN